MATPLLETKLFVPVPRPGLVPRRRLSELLDRGTASKLTLVSAPAGFGKTTLLAECLTAEGRSIAWLSLDRGDDDAASFWSYVMTALRTVSPEVGAIELALMQESPPPPIEGVLTTLLNDLGGSSDDVVLVLDDYHVIDSREIHDGMTFLLDHSPPQLHVVIASRADPAMPLARLRARGELVEIRAAELRFTIDEATAYLNETMGLELTSEDVAALEDRTEGWIAALQLAAISMKGRDDVADFIAGFTGDDRFIVDYLVEEVLHRQPDQVQAFLLQTAILDRLSAPLCDAVTEQGSGKAMLETLDRGNLFLVPLDDRRQWYRYHHLFADVLHARLLDEQSDHVHELHQRASAWFASHGLVADAVRHALAAADFDRAGYLMEEALPATRRTRQDALLLTWVRALPEEVVRRSPVLSIVSGWSLLMAGDLDALELRLDDAEAALAAGAEDEELRAAWADTEDLRTAPATVSVYRASLAQARGDVPGTARHARRALDLAGPDDHWVRGGGSGFLGLAAWAAGDVEEALSTFSVAVRSLHAAGNLVDELDSTVVLADMWVAAGRPSRARRLCEHALLTATESDVPHMRATADLHVALAELDRELDDLISAEAHLETARVLGERTSITENRHRWFVAMAQVRATGGDHETATRLLDQAESLYRRGFYPEVRPVAAVKARLQIAAGDMTSAHVWADHSGIDVGDDPDYLHEYEHLTLARLLLAQKNCIAVLDLLERLNKAANDAGREGSVLEIRVLQALAHHAADDLASALGTLQRALDDAPEPESHVRLYLDEGPSMIALLRHAADAGDTAGEHARRLLERAAQAEVPEPQQALVNPLSKRELEVLRLLDSELTGPEIARELYVTLNTLRTHTKRIFTKLDATTRAAAVLRAREHGLL
ncbi:LuxR C-terminal-related transcriptional regulator [Aeromicrobium sp.]|uniref:LuxR C-terminal-related transcriptional regulator n=1 Tax=Aeromicrobium sp. TaxID=1871063 RepID=UPI003D6ADE77